MVWFEECSYRKVPLASDSKEIRHHLAGSLPSSLCVYVCVRMSLSLSLREKERGARKGLDSPKKNFKIRKLYINICRIGM